jgi:hypothetical protein
LTVFSGEVGDSESDANKDGENVDANTVGECTFSGIDDLDTGARDARGGESALVARDTLERDASGARGGAPEARAAGVAKLAADAYSTTLARITPEYCLFNSFVYLSKESLVSGFLRFDITKVCKYGYNDAHKNTSTPRRCNFWIK